MRRVIIQRDSMHKCHGYLQQVEIGVGQLSDSFIKVTTDTLSELFTRLEKERDTDDK